ncbi:MAG TPA: GNAT family N-acetyltransferase [Streptosporangiaceae bacterium]|nr:GNAT family N-acetyltransferase [Streptosporangiaceae bacterium]
MRIEQVDLTDTEKIRECFEVALAAQRVDEPQGPWFTERPFGGWLTVGWDGGPREVWLAVDRGSAAGWYRLSLPSRANLDRAGLILAVHPAERRRGLGLALLRHAAGRAAAHGRAVLDGGARNGSPGEAFARAAGAKPGLVEVERVLDLGRVEQGKLARLREPAERAAGGYSLESWAGPVPEEFLGDVAVLYNAMGDAPRDREIAHEEWDAQRVREGINDLRPHYGLRVYTVVARHDDTGEVAALTEIAVDPANPGWGYQMNTVVTKKHRGHRLGLLVKLAMMELLVTTEPQLERITTWNAEVNEHMIAINEAIGYAVWGQAVTDLQLEVAAVLPAGG